MYKNNVYSFQFRAQKLTLATFFFNVELSAFYFKIRSCYLREIIYYNS